MNPTPTNTALFAAMILGSMFLSACQSPAPPQVQAPREVHTAAYDLIVPAEPKALLILFPCFSCDAADTRSESPIADWGGGGLSLSTTRASW